MIKYSAHEPQSLNLFQGWAETWVPSPIR